MWTLTTDHSIKKGAIENWRSVDHDWFCFLERDIHVEEIAKMLGISHGRVASTLENSKELAQFNARSNQRYPLGKRQ